MTSIGEWAFDGLEDYDLDKDGHVNIADVTKLVNFILKHPELK